MNQKKDIPNDSGAAIVCSHVAQENYPILCAKKDEPLDPVDSGWQFLCYSGKDENDGKIWAISEVIELEPTLKNLLNQPVGTTLIRKNKNADWFVVKDN